MSCPWILTCVRKRTMRTNNRYERPEGKSLEHFINTGLCLFFLVRHLLKIYYPLEAFVQSTWHSYPFCWISSPRVQESLTVNKHLIHSLDQQMTHHLSPHSLNHDGQQIKQTNGDKNVREVFLTALQTMLFWPNSIHSSLVNSPSEMSAIYEPPVQKSN